MEDKIEISTEILKKLSEILMEREEKGEWVNLLDKEMLAKEILKLMKKENNNVK
jgi:hypothetical protein